LIALGHKSRALYMWIEVHFILLIATHVTQQKSNGNIDIVDKAHNYMLRDVTYVTITILSYWL